MNHRKKIAPSDLVPMDMFTGDFPIQIDMAYARDDNLLFGERIYREDARLWLHRDLAEVVLRAARSIHERHGFGCVLYDGLRTVDAQDAMLKTARVGENPHWLEEPRLLSPPGAGAHPRAMAIDMALVDADGALVDMGTAFDFLAERPDAAHNAAHREYAHSEAILQNRAILTDAMHGSAQGAGKQLLALPQEWWDFRFPPSVYDAYDSLSDHNLPPQMTLVSANSDSHTVDFEPVHFERLKQEVINAVNR